MNSTGDDVDSTSLTRLVRLASSNRCVTKWLVQDFFAAGRFPRASDHEFQDRSDPGVSVVARRQDLAVLDERIEADVVLLREASTKTK